jgi:8-oxo-dGTP diphosphatase
LKPTQVATAAIFVKVDTTWRLLLQQRSPRREFPLHWECPGGKLEADEKPTDAVRRELMEELTIDVGPVYSRPIVTCAYNRPTGRVSYDVALYFVLLEAEKVLQISVQDAVGIGLFEIEEMRRMVCVPSCYVLAEQITRMGGIAAVAKTFLLEVGHDVAQP